MSLKDSESYSLSNEDILRIVKDKKVRIIAYPEFAKIDNIVDYMSVYPNIIIFFEEDKTKTAEIGHWEALKMVGNVIMFFDSYGLKPDQARSYLSKNKLIQLKEYEPLLHPLFIKAHKMGYKILYNHVRYQEMAPNISTCGKYSCAFILHGTLINNEFNTFMLNIKKAYKSKTFDQAITEYSFENWGI